MKKFFLFALMICSMNLFADDTMVTISGTIVHDQSNPQSYQGEFIFKKDTTVTLTLNTCSGDGSCYEALRKSFSGVTAFPIPFQLQVKKGQYALMVSVRSAGGASDRVGDLVNEYLILVGKKNEDIQVKASGLELCSDENSGGFCIH